MTLQEYRDLVGRVMQDALVGGAPVSRAFKNDGVDHARIVLSTMVDHAQDSFSLYSGSMSADVWDADLVRAFVTRVSGEGPAVRVLLDEPDAPASALAGLDDLVASGRVAVRVVGEERPLSQHIAVADRRHVRIERDARTRKAVVVFGDRDIGGTATELFDRAWNAARPMASAAI